MGKMITPELLKELNNKLCAEGYSFRYKYSESPEETINPTITIVPINVRGLDSFILNVDNAFYDRLVKWFKDRGIELACNNTRSILWSLNGWNFKQRG